MKFPIQRNLFFSILIAALLLISCNPGGGETALPITNLTPENSVATLQSAPYLDIENSAIYNCSADLEYSQDGGSTWSVCTGGIQSLSLALGDHVWLRDSSDTSWSRDLGTVDQLSSAPDLTPGKNIFIGEAYIQDNQNIWRDDYLVRQGETVDILSEIVNMGQSGTYTFNIQYYLSGDNQLDTGEDLLIKTINLNYPNDSFESRSNIYLQDFTYTVSSAQEPGIYYIGMVIDSQGSLAELNENNNQSLPEEMVPIVITDSSTTNGAFKVVNSWGEGDWENIADGSYWLPFETMKDNKMAVYFYTNGFENEYVPTALAVFEIDHAYRDEVMISFGIGNPDSPMIEKNFDAYRERPMGGAQPFPANKMVLDISELAYLINNGDLFMRISNSGSTSGTMVSFAVEFYDPATGSQIDYGTNYDCTTTSDLFVAPETLYTIPTEGTFSQAHLETITVDINNGLGSGLVMAPPSAAETARDFITLGGTPESYQFNRIHQGAYGTGYRAPSRDELAGIQKLNTDKTSYARSSFNKVDLPLSVDNSQSPYFPPIGNQGIEGSCASFSVAYYIQTYTEAKERGWDLSTSTWDNSATTVNSAGAPDSMLDKIFSPDFFYHQINNGEDQGSSQIFAIELVIQQGGATWSTMPYSDSDYTSWPGETAWREAPQYRGNRFGNLYFDTIKGGYFIIETNNDIQMLKSLLASGYIVSTSIDSVSFFGGQYPSEIGGGTVPSSLSSKDVILSGTSFATYNSGGSTYLYIDHAQTVVGYKEGTEWDPSNPDS